MKTMLDWLINAPIKEVLLKHDLVAIWIGIFFALILGSSFIKKILKMLGEDIGLRKRPGFVLGRLEEIIFYLAIWKEEAFRVRLVYCN